MVFTLRNEDFVKLTKYIKTNYGINLSHKKTLIEGRLSNMLLKRGFKSFSEYIEYVFADASHREIDIIIDKLTTNHTFFMRESSHFVYFRDQVLPYLQSSVKQKDLRIWSAGCSSGEEPYTLAMILGDYFGDDKPLWDTKVLATDISSTVLNTAERGIYPGDALDKLPAAWKINYFQKSDAGNYQVAGKLRSEVIFREFNLNEAVFPFKKKFHVIFCRNVMIYFDEKTKMQLVNKFYEMTEPGGYLFIGHSETINRNETYYRYVMPAVYRKG